MAGDIRLSKQLRLNYGNGTNDKGEMLIKRKIYNNISSDATSEQLVATGQALASLQTLPLINVEQQVTEIIA